MKRNAVLQAQLMAEISQESEAWEWEQGIGLAMKGVGKHKRKLQASGGGEVELAREDARCSACGAGFFPVQKHHPDKNALGNIFRLMCRNLLR
jgi:hypothetical protein